MPLLETSMISMTKPAMLPKKLRDDSIIEALCELRFRSTEAVPEIIVGRLSDIEAWKMYNKSTLPLSNIPAPIRRAEQDLMYAPYIQLQGPDNSRLVQIGENVLSYHVVGKYCGWPSFRPELHQTIIAIFDRVPNLTVTRLGFRYINALTTTRHFVAGINDLSLEISVDKQSLEVPFNLGYETHQEDYIITSRVASPQYVRGKLPPDTSMVVDIDVHTPPEYETTDIEAVLSWVDHAHDYEKKAFFRLLPQELQDKLKEE